MLMGILLAYLTLRTRSIWPAVVVHFTNNALSVIMDFLDTYSTFSPLEWIGNLMADAYPAFILFVLLMAGIMVLMIMIINKIASKKFRGGFMSMVDGDGISFMQMANMVHPNISCDYARYKPTLKDFTFYISAIFITVIATLFTLIWGVF